MCKAGDIIVVQKYKSHGRDVSRHSFVVIDDQGGEIQGLSFDFASLVMSSFKDEEQKARKMKYPGNFPIVAEDLDVCGGNDKSGYIKAEQFYYFNKDTIDYAVIGYLKPEIFNLLIEFIQDLVADGIILETRTDNL